MSVTEIGTERGIVIVTRIAIATGGTNYEPPCLQYSNSSPFFLVKNRRGDKKSQINEFFDDLISQCEKEYDVISRVFPNPPAVMRELAQRIFEQKVWNFLKKI
jgi:hypothetical protein